MTISARIRAAAGALSLLLLHSPEPAAAGRPFMQAGLRWQALTRADGAALDYQALRPFLRVSSGSLGPYGLRLHLDAHGKKGLAERGGGPADPFADRLLVNRAHIELNGPARLRALAGRHRPPLRGLGVATVDGVSLQRRTAAWGAAFSWGLQSAFWRPNAPFGGTEPLPTVCHPGRAFVRVVLRKQHVCDRLGRRVAQNLS